MSPSDASAEPTVVFFDIGGVLLTNGWDHVSRGRAAARFALDDGFEARHVALANALDTSKMSLDAYLDRVVFDRPRAFSRDELVAFIQAESQPHPEALAVLDEVVATGRYRVFALNNESRELNNYRIETFQLARRFDAFLSSCYLGMAKPDPAIYTRALELLQQPAEACVFVDDREENLVSAALLGVRTILHQHAAGTRDALRAVGVRI